jgi:hypothetical protein
MDILIYSRLLLANYFLKNYFIYNNISVSAPFSLNIFSNALQTHVFKLAILIS